MKGFTTELLRQSEAGKRPENQHLFEPAKKEKKKSNRGNIPTEVNGIKFDSRKEAERYKTLLLLVKAGEITLPELQVPYELNEGGSHSYKYIADFRYRNQKTGELVVEDVKGGYLSPVYKKKRKLMKKLYGIEILET